MLSRSTLTVLLASGALAIGVPASVLAVDGAVRAAAVSLSPAAADVMIRGKVEAALAGEASLHGADIVVDVVDRVILLSGEVGSVAQRDTAGRLAAGVPDVKKVMNELMVMKSG
ncbi:MAG: BON domain-containing protein [Rhodocyclaceae bacterium]|nr:BON domain-containing protein [Rhodocyclaceae bacterium]